MKIPEFNPPNTSADEGKIKSWAEILRNFEGRITGKSGTSYDKLNSSAIEFSDTISSKIKETGEYNHRGLFRGLHKSGVR